jgi:hypothetical protein
VTFAAPEADSVAAVSQRQPAQALLWLLICGALFCAGYGAANLVAAQHGDVPSIRFGWEQSIPFLPWTIFPYWSFDLFYPLSFFVCADAGELQRHVRRILTAQLVAVICFLVFPLHLAVAKPPTEGLSGLLFTALGSMDRPYNQAPSLHIALLIILWHLYARHIPKRFHPLWHCWSVLVGVSVLTTWQHHFIDVLTGGALGFLCLWLWPESGEPRFPIRRSSKAGRPL